MPFEGHVSARSAFDAPPAAPIHISPSPPPASAKVMAAVASRVSLRGPVSVAWREGVLDTRGGA